MWTHHSTFLHGYISHTTLWCTTQAKDSTIHAPTGPVILWPLYKIPQRLPPTYPPLTPELLHGHEDSAPAPPLIVTNPRVTEALHRYPFTSGTPTGTPALQTYLRRRVGPATTVSLLIGVPRNPHASLFKRAPLKRHLGCFHFLAIRNKGIKSFCL